jgi:hypothetical protein
MPSCFPQDLPIVMEESGYVARATECGSFTIVNEQAPAGTDPAPLFRGLPDDRCQCEHVGMVLRGEITFRYPDHEETVVAGQVYHVFPGHLPIVKEDAEIVEFTLTTQLNQTIAVVAANIESGVRPVEIASV